MAPRCAVALSSRDGGPWLVLLGRRSRLVAKFTQHPTLKELLLSTGNARLAESATVDNEVNRFWGEVNGVGRNHLGILLMELREQLRIEQVASPKRKPAKIRRPRAEAATAVA